MGVGHKLTSDDGVRGLIRFELSDGKKLKMDDQGIMLDDNSGNSLIIHTSGGEMKLSTAAKIAFTAPPVEINGSLSLTASAGVAAKSTAPQ